MVNEDKKQRNIIFFYHKNHNDQFNGTSVYDKAMLDALENEYNITAVEPVLSPAAFGDVKYKNAHYFVNLVKQVYFRQLRWLINIFRGRHLTPPENTVLLVEDIYSAPIPLLVSKLKGYKLLFRAADFGESYSRTLFEEHTLDRVIYSAFRKIMEKLLVQNSSLIICPSKSVESAVMNRYEINRDKVAFLPYVRTGDLRRNYVHNREARLPDSGSKVVLLFMGDFRYPPNYYAGNYVVNELVPKLNSQVGNYEILIAGQNSQSIYVDSPHVKVLGPVEDIENLIFSAHIGLAPMRTIGGLSMKIVDYLTHGLRVVATPEAANGIEANGQMKLSKLSDFHIAVENEIVHALNNGHELHKVSDLVAKVYMTDKWKKNLVEKINNILPEAKSL